MLFRAQIIRPVTGSRVRAPLVLVRHGKSRPCQRPLRYPWLMGRQPAQMGLTRMHRPALWKSPMVFHHEFSCQTTEPAIIGNRGADPDCAGMIAMNGLVRLEFGRSCRIETRYMMRRPQHLHTFQNHFDDMFVTVPLCRSSRHHGQEKDVHHRVGRLRPTSIKFLRGIIRGCQEQSGPKIYKR
jgi:hypothetical protein